MTFSCEGFFMRLSDATRNLKRLLDAIEEATGRRPHISTAIRWRTRGCSGIRLDAVMIGNQWFSTVDAVRAFVEATTTARSGRQLAVETPSQATHHAERSAKQLAKRLGTA